jgi:hypothetical protein
VLRRLTARGGRSCLVWSVVGFVAIQLTLGLAIDRKLTEVRDPAFYHKRALLRARTAERPADPLVVALGSSRMRMGLMAGSMHLNAGGKPALVCNCGVEGVGPVKELIFLKRLLDDGVRPSALLVEVMPGFFCDRPGRLLDEKDINPGSMNGEEIVRVAHLCKSPRVAIGHWLVARTLPCYWYAADLGLNGVPDRARTHDPIAAPPYADGYGWEAVRLGVSSEQRRDLTKILVDAYEDFYRHEEIAAEPVQALRLLLDLCRQRDILVHLVLMPEASAFRALYRPNFSAALDRTLGGICKQYGVSLTNAREWLPDEGFYDGIHQLPGGAAEFTAHLERHLRSLENIRSLTTPEPIGLLLRGDSHHG